MHNKDDQFALYILGLEFWENLFPSPSKDEDLHRESDSMFLGLVVK